MAVNGLTPIREKIILTLADSKMNMSETGRRLYLHQHSVVYNIKRIKDITGKDPLNFYDLYDLVQMVKGGAGNGT